MRSNLLLITTLCSSVAVTTAQGIPASRPEIVRQLQHGDNAAALSLAREALRVSPRDCVLLSLQAVAETGLHHQEAALASFQEALSFCPTYLPALEGATQIEYAQQSSDVSTLLLRLLAVQPQNVTAHAMLASVLRARQDCSGALPHFEASKALFPARPDLLQGYGLCLSDVGDLRSALAVYQQLLATGPNDLIRYDVALLQWKTRASDDALTTLNPLLTGAHQVPAMALASKILEEKGETPEAVARLREAILQEPDDINNYLDFATIAFTHKSFQIGINMLDAGLQRSPNAAALYVARGVLEIQLSKSELAVADFHKAHQLDSKMSFAVDALGVVQTQQHESEKSLELFEAQAKQHPEDPLLQYLFAEQLSQKVGEDDGNRLTAAIVAAKRAADLDPNYLAAHDLLAVLYVRTRQPELAIQQAKLALEQDPDDETALYQELMATRSSGDKSQIKILTAKLEEARKQTGLRQQTADKYRLQ